MNMMMNKDVPIDALCELSGVNKVDTMDFLHFYNNHYDRYGNEIYQRIESRITHLLNYSEDWWFNHRLDYYIENANKYDCVIDAGFSVPYIYLSDQIEKAKHTRFVFVDNATSAIDFYDTIVELFGLKERAELDCAIKADLESSKDYAKMHDIVAKINPNKLLIAAIEVLEHLDDTQSFFDFAEKIAKLVPHVDINITLPIGCKIPSHAHEFVSKEYALKFVESRIQLEKQDLILPQNGDYVSPYLRGCLSLVGHPHKKK